MMKCKCLKIKGKAMDYVPDLGIYSSIWTILSLTKNTMSDQHSLPYRHHSFLYYIIKDIFELFSIVHPSK